MTKPTHTFALRKLDISGKLNIYVLVVNDVCEYDHFEALIKQEGTWTKQLNTIQTRLAYVAIQALLPEEKFRDITPRGELVKEYEIKTPNLRVYLIHEEPDGRIIVCAGKKTTQSKDITHFRTMKRLYLESKQP
jgi:putative component of toxin-antitoxin plasmid stabilization module